MSEGFENVLTYGFNYSADVISQLKVNDLHHSWSEEDGFELMRNSAHVVKVNFIHDFLFRDDELAIYAYDTQWS
jgi:hypothetical protein